MDRLAPNVPTLLRTHGIAAPEQPLTHNGFSGARITSLDQGADRFILKRVRYADDWIMRTTADVHCREAQVAASPIIDRLPPALAVPSIGAAHDGDGAAILMRDITSSLLPDDQPIDGTRTDALLAALARMHATFWDDPLTDAGVDWCPARERLTLLSPAIGPQLVDEGHDFGLARGWRAFDDHAAPPARTLAQRLFVDPSPLVEIAASLPQALLHGDIKFANVGVDPELGRVYLFDWALVLRGPVALDLCWFPAVNTPQLPWSPDETIDRYAAHLRSALGERRFAAAQWPRQRALSAIGALLLMGWAKALDHEDSRPDELTWLGDRALKGAELLGL